MNREKYDCWYEYNAKNMGIREKKDMTITTSGSSSSSYYTEQLRQKYEREAQ